MYNKDDKYQFIIPYSLNKYLIRFFYIKYCKKKMFNFI